MTGDDSRETSMTTTERAMAFLDGQDRPVETAWPRHVAASGPRERVIDALAFYQNDDGGFGRGLEVDIKAPDSQPFAARLAMQVLISIGAGSDEPMVQRLTEWLEREQGDDGDWHFSPGIYQHELAPWFAGWTFPSLNPALCLGGAATRLGIGSPALHQRVRALADRMASVEAIADGEFYTVLPYAEYFPWVEHPERDTYVTALVARIEQDARGGTYADAGHFFEHAGPAGGAIARRLSPDVIAAQLDRLAAEQQPDGGWPTPYDQGWRPWSTASNAVTLRAFGHA